MRRARSSRPRAGEERPAGEDEHRQRDQQARPAHRLLRAGSELAAGDVRGEGVHHDLHRAEGRDEQPPERRAPLARIRFALARRLVGNRLVADRANRADDAAGVGLRRIPGDKGAAGREVDVGARHART
jgi:hypothetical protein